jgi:hypothetical protein
MTTIIVVTSYEQDARQLADKIRALGFPVMGIYAHEEYRDGIGHTQESVMVAEHGKRKLLDTGDWPVRDFA